MLMLSKIEENKLWTTHSMHPCIVRLLHKTKVNELCPFLTEVNAVFYFNKIIVDI